MLHAALYLTGATLRNRVRIQLRRLRSPRYVLGLAAGIAYVWWFLLRPAQDGGAAAIVGGGWQLPLASLGVVALVCKWWLVGADPRALAFSPAEVHLLFPAPVTRRGLVAYKLLRAQLVILVNTVVWTVLLRGGGGELASWRRALALWVLFSVLHLHRLGAALVTAPVPDGAPMPRWRAVGGRLLPLLLVAAALGALIVPLVRAGDRLAVAWDAGVLAVLPALAAALEAPGAAAVLAPARALLGATFAPGGGAWARAMALPLLLLAAHFAWVLHVDAAVQEAALAVGERRQRRRWWRRRSAGAATALPPAAGGGSPAADGVPAPLRPGSPASDAAGDAGNVARRRWTPPLSASGWPAGAIVWKNAVAALRATALVRLLTLYSALAAGLLVLAARNPRMAELATVVTVVWSAMLLVAGPLWFRVDLRQDLARLATLRAWPLRGREIVRAQVLASAGALTVAHLAMLGLLLAATTGARDALWPDGSERLAYAAAAALALPGVNLASLTVHNGAALLFPGWTRPAGGSRGVEAMGQNLVSTAGASAVLVLLLAAPAALAGAVGWGLWTAAGVWAAVPAAAVLSVLTVLELGPVHGWLGRVLERLEPGADGGGS